jgi:hypothetical protein
VILKLFRGSRDKLQALTVIKDKLIIKSAEISSILSTLPYDMDRHAMLKELKDKVNQIEYRDVFEILKLHTGASKIDALTIMKTKIAKLNSEQLFEIKNI